MFFRFRQIVDPGDVTVGEFLQFIEAVPFRVLGNRLVLERLFQTLIRVPSDVVDGCAVVFRDFVHLPGKLLAALFRQRRNRKESASYDGKEPSAKMSTNFTHRDSCA